MTVLVQSHRQSTAADVAFLRDRCSLLQRALGEAADPNMVDDEAFDGEVMRRWTRLLVPAVPWPPRTQMVLEELYVLHARVLERIARGGVEDISRDVEHLVRALLVDKLQQATDRAVSELG